MHTLPTACFETSSVSNYPKKRTYIPSVFQIVPNPGLQLHIRKFFEETSQSNHIIFILKLYLKGISELSMKPESIYHLDGQLTPTSPLPCTDIKPSCFWLYGQSVIWFCCYRSEKTNEKQAKFRLCVTIPR